LIFAVVTESTPQPRDFRGDTPAAEMVLNDSVAITNRGTYIPRIGFTRSWSGNEAVAPQEGLPAVASGGIDWLLIFGTMIISLFVFNFTEGVHMRNSLIALWLALSVYTGAFIAENVRAGILAVSKGQTEAASALGMQPSRTMRLVVLPQAMRVIIPPLISQFLNLTKNSSLAIAVGYMDVRATLGGITINQTGRELEGMLLLGLFYLVLSLVISGAMNVYNNSMKLKER